MNSVRVLHPGPGGHQGIESQHQLGGHPTPGMTQRIPFSLGPPQLEYGTPGMTVRIRSPHLLSRVHTACLTLHLTIGGS